MSKMDDFIARTRAQQDQIAAAKDGWIKSIPHLEELAKTELVRLPKEHKDVSARTINHELHVKFGDRAIGFGGLHADHVQKGARIVFYFENETGTVWSERTPYHKQGTSPPIKKEDHGSLDEDAFTDALVRFVEWATVGEGCGGHMKRF